jgi:polyribonucleotide nucleotidyltransferase
VIGKGGATIRDITEKTGASVDINDDGSIKIFAADKASADAAIAMIQAITAEIEVGITYEGKVSKIVDFGAFITVLPGKDGLLHISQISEDRVENVADFLTEGQMVKVHVMDVDPKGRVKLTMKGVEQ